jgi:tetratricopeptide (TPR) repeat protein
MFVPLASSVIFVAFVATVASPAAAGAQGAHGAHAIPSVPQEILERSIGLRTGIGVAPSAATDPPARALVIQGWAFLHSYAWIDAARSFNEALRLDPRLARAHLGLSYAYEELNKPEAARHALERARALATMAGDGFRRHVEVRTTQLQGDLTAYRAALDAALESAATDTELLLLRGMAESGSVADRGQGSTQASIPLYKRALALNSSSAAAHHYLVHAYENTGRIEQALAHAREYVRLAPAVPHAHHMLGHDLRRLGQIRQAIAEFRKAYELETDRARIAEVPPVHDWHHQHNLDLLAASHQYIGQVRTAEHFLRTSFEIPSALVIQAFNKHEWPAFLLARGRTDEALTSARILTTSPAGLVRAVGHVMTGRALLALRRFPEVAEASNTALKELRASGPEASLAAPHLQGLQAEFFLRTGKSDKALTMFRDVRRKFRALPGPDGWSQALFHLESIGRAAVAMGAWDVAEETAADMMAHDHAYGGTQYLAALVAECKGDREAMIRHLHNAQVAWRDAEAEFAELEDVRVRLAAGRKSGLPSPDVPPPAPCR